MDSIFTYLKLKFLYLVSIQEKLDTFLYLLIYGLLILPNIVFAEGSKEIYVGTKNTGLYFCNDFVNQCNPSGNGFRTQFAIYDCDSIGRLNFEVYSTDEIVYLGIDGITV